MAVVHTYTKTTTRAVERAQVVVVSVVGGYDGDIDGGGDDNDDDPHAADAAVPRIRCGLFYHHLLPPPALHVHILICHHCRRHVDTWTLNHFFFN